MHAVWFVDERTGYDDSSISLGCYRAQSFLAIWLCDIGELVMNSLLVIVVFPGVGSYFRLDNRSVRFLGPLKLRWHDSASRQSNYECAQEAFVIRVAFGGD